MSPSPKPPRQAATSTPKSPVALPHRQPAGASSPRDVARLSHSQDSFSESLKSTLSSTPWRVPQLQRGDNMEGDSRDRDREPCASPSF